ncbi:MAG: L-2-hydroxyglutarate oxidase [Nitrospira sp.]|nr:L-2-hydroxyglutarate oxidase [Nitrospira sp.]
MLVVPRSCDFLVIGAGVIGITIAWELRRRYGVRVCVIDKEAAVGMHASGRNSGVLHAGVYYKPHSLKARLCVEGNKRMRDYCRDRGIPLNEHGKVIVTRKEAELTALRELYERARSNGVTVALLDAAELKEIEPCARTVGQALYVKETSVVDPQQVMKSLANEAVKDGVEFRLRCTWEGFAGMDQVRTSQGALSYGYLVNCAGLFADQVAHAHGVGTQYKILPFRGQFYRLRPESKVKVRGNIYPVPDLRNPFLGIHFTARPNGDVTMGPSALPLFGREQYEGLTGVTASDCLTMLGFLTRLWSRNQDHFRSIAWTELKKLSRRGFFHEARGLVKGLVQEDLLIGKSPGIRAQLVDMQTSELTSDFVVEHGSYSTHVLNAVSPAFTSSLPFAEYVVNLIKEKVQ